MAACQASLSITDSRSLPKLMSIESVMPSNHLIFCHPLLLPPSIFPSIRVFSNESVLCIRWPKYWSFSFNISPSNEYSGLISFRMDWLDILKVQGTLKSLLQHHSSEASILWHSAFFTVQLSHVGSQREELRPWQRSWGTKHGLRKGMIKPQETPCSRASIPQTRVLYGELSPITISLREGVNLQLQFIKIPGCDKSVSTYELWRFSGLPDQAHLAACDCLQPPNCERHGMF